MKYYAAENSRGFANTWTVLVFDSKTARDTYVEARDGYDYHSQRTIDCRAIKKSQVTQFATNYSLSQNREVKPRPFRGECWMVGDWDEMAQAEIPGYIGAVFVGVDGCDRGIRLF